MEEFLQSELLELQRGRHEADTEIELPAAAAEPEIAAPQKS